jgi:two-component system, NtrC family, sensor kinase
MTPEFNRRILIIDDSQAIHDDFRKALSADWHPRREILEAESDLFGAGGTTPKSAAFEIDSAYQGEEGVAKIRQATTAGRPYAMAFVDVRMPPGWDGIETAARIWREYQELQVVICTAFSDYAWEDIIRSLGASDQWVILKKPFENIEVIQLAHAMTAKWSLTRQARCRLQDLEKMVAVRTWDLQMANQQLKQALRDRLHMEEQLRQAQKLESVGQLAAGVAHHFNQLFQIIQHQAELASMETTSLAQTQAGLKEISTAVDQAIGLTRQLLVFSRRQLMRPHKLDVNALIHEVAPQVRKVLGSALSLRLELAPDLPSISADANLLEQVLLTLVANARDAMPRGGQAEIKTSARNIDAAFISQQPQAKSGPHLCLSVSDTGCGMDALTQSRLFEPFFTTKEIGKGAGLGLATIYGIIKQHQGWIQIISQPGQGSTFHVFLPVQEPVFDGHGSSLVGLPPSTAPNAYR